MAHIGRKFTTSRYFNREQPRLRMELPAFFRKVGDKDFVDCKIIDIGVKGVGVDLKTSVMVDDAAEIKFTLQGVEMKFFCKVIYVLGKFVGLSFNQIEPKEALCIQKFVYENFFKV